MAENSEEQKGGNKTNEWVERMAKVNFLSIVFGGDFGKINVRSGSECTWVSLATALTRAIRNQGDIKAASNTFLHGGRCRKAPSWQFCGDVMNAEPTEKDIWGAQKEKGWKFP